MTRARTLADLGSASLATDAELASEVATLDSTISGLALGKVLQVVPISDSTTASYGTVTAGTWYPITSTEASITTTSANSKILYCCSIPAELDGSMGNLFQSLHRSIGGSGSYGLLGDSVTNGPSSAASGNYPDQGTINMTMNFVDAPNQSIGTLIYYKVYFAIAATTPSIEWNQSSLSGQPSGTTNRSVGYLMEIAA